VGIGTDWVDGVRCRDGDTEIRNELGGDKNCPMQHSIVTKPICKLNIVNALDVIRYDTIKEFNVDSKAEY